MRSLGDEYFVTFICSVLLAGMVLTLFLIEVFK